jgi:phosphatidylglycerol:prolipoprotein diacylglycerol transferase
MFALMGQPIGRLGNVINGDIIGKPTDLPWGFVYTNPNSFPPSHTVAYQPAAIYEIICNLVLIAVLFPLRNRLKPGWLTASYIAGYCITQLIVFIWRTEPVYAGLREAQWTAIAVLAIEGVVVLVRLRLGRWPWLTAPHRSEAAAQPAPSGQ